MISTAVFEHDSPPPLILYVNQTLQVMFPRKSLHIVLWVPRMFVLRDWMIKGKSVGFLLLRLRASIQQFNLFTKKNQTAVCQSMNFLSHFFSVLWKTIGPTLTNQFNFLKILFFLYFEMVKEEKRCAKEQHCLITLGTFKGQDNEILEYLCSERNCVVLIVLHYLTKKFYLFE